MKKPVYTAVCFLMLQCCFLHAQTPDPLSFFPHHQGDVFEYQIYQSTAWFQNIILRDSLGPDGKYYLETTEFGRVQVDTAGYEVRNRQWGGQEYSTLLFRLDADSGDAWISWRDESSAIVAQVVYVYQSVAWGEQVTVKRIAYTDSASGLFFQGFSLASKFGIVEEYGDFSLVYYLRGARINGITYGIVTSVDDNPPDTVPHNLILCQNYPNPFNSTTTINYNLPVNTRVLLKLYDLVGREVATLVDEFQTQGPYIKRYNASNLPTGVFIYRLTTSHGTISKRMMLIR